ncbi:MAG: phosphoesterase, partial [Kiritimatiellales bacterium]|nr:phosphoesterase [Kiritimatiellales bacterium]
LIHQAGGVSVLAHPSTLYMPDAQLRALVGELKEHGLGGIETYYAAHPQDIVAKFSKWAQAFDLICTGGTDFHGANTPDLRLGTGFGQLEVPDEALDQLKAAIPPR